MNLIFTCGGTAGHINPAIAIAGEMRRRHPDCKILFIGAQGHMEEKLVPQAGYELRTLPGSGLSRKKNLEGLRQNLHAVDCVLKATKTCREIFREFRPHVIIGTGGYASFPALYAGSKMGIPTCVHESNAVPGVTTKMAARRATRVLVAFEESVACYAHPERVEVVGMPVQQDFLYEDKKSARQKLGLGDGPVVLSAFGSLGAKRMNEMVAELFCMEKEAGFPFHHVHATGGFGWEWMPELLEKDGLDLPHTSAIDLREYIYDMPLEMAAADVVISRSGAATCNEIAVSGTPAILIPSPNVTNNHQEHNARVLSDRNAAVTILEKDCTARRVMEEIQALLADPQRREDMSKTLRTMVRLDSTQRICDIVEGLIKER